MSAQLFRSPPFRAEHVGSLLRTEELLQKKTAFENGQVPESDLIAVEDRDIKQIVETQKKIGFAAATDGEYRRHSKSACYFAWSRVNIDVSSVLGYIFPRPRWIR